MADGPQKPMCLDLPFDEVVLRPFPQGSHCNGFVFRAREHDERNVGRRGTSAPQRFEPLGIGQSQVEQDDVNRMFRERLFGPPDVLHVHQLDVVPGELLEHLAEQTAFSEPVVNQEDPGGPRVRGQLGQASVAQLHLAAHRLAPAALAECQRPTRPVSIATRVSGRRICSFHCHEPRSGASGSARSPFPGRIGWSPIQRGG